MNFDELPEFGREYKRLGKKFRSLQADLQIFRAVTSVSPTGSSVSSTIIYREENLLIVKARFFCRYLRGRSLRVIYAYHMKQNRVVLIEIYHKADKSREDKVRIKQYIANYSDKGNYGSSAAG